MNIFPTLRLFILLCPDVAPVDTFMVLPVLTFISVTDALSPALIPKLPVADNFSTTPL